MKLINALIFAVATLVLSMPVQATVDNKNPYKLVEQVAEKTFSRLKANQSAIRANPNLLKDVIREEMLPYISYKFAALKVLGGYYKKFPPEEVSEFAEVFKDYIVTSYAQIFTLYDGQKVQFEAQKAYDGEKAVSVTTTVLVPNATPIQIEFKVRLNRSSGEWEAYDLVAEGVSMLDSKKAELDGIIRQKGLTAVTAMLKEKASLDITYTEKS